MKRLLRYALILGAVAMVPALSPAQEQAAEDKPTSQSATIDVSTIEWQTDMDEPEIGSSKAVRGGTFRMGLPSYPKTFRLVGPNANDMFANWNNAFGMLSLVGRHPTTDEFIPVLATHWYVAPDNKTVYYKLDQNARWSDGRKVTADDYLFAWDFLRDPRIADPFYNSFLPRVISGVEKIDDYTIKIVAAKESWRPLVDTSSLMPYPKHAISLDESNGTKWVDRANLEPPVTVGPYVIDKWQLNETVTFKRIANWWGDKHRYLKNHYNPDFIELKVIADADRELDYFIRGQLDYVEIRTARHWAERLDFEALKKGWVKARQVYLEPPEGVYGIGFNTAAPVFKDKNFRKALQHLFNFEVLNKELMFNAYTRQSSVFQNTEYMNKDLVPYSFDPRKAREYLQAAGFTQRDNDGIYKKPSGERASFTLLYGNPGIEKHLTVVQNFFKKGGVEMKLQRLDSGAAFDRLRKKATEAFLTGMTAGFYPEPFQYFHSSQAINEQGNLKEETNNFWTYHNPRVDELIDTYQYELDEEKRKAAMAELDQIIHDEAILIPFWYAPYARMLYWDYVQWPEEYFPRRASGLIDAWVFWIDQEKQAKLPELMRQGQPAPGEPGPIDVDPYGVKKRIQQMESSSGGQ